jgi:glycerophosphoryl diester phosphodiesterase
MPEHTLAAYLRALDDGADGLECDVRLSRDGHLICVHDRRLNRTSNGRGPVSAKTLAELDALDFGSWHPGSVLPDDPPNPDRSRLLTLNRLLNRGGPLRLLIETKHPSPHGAEVERRLVALLRHHGLADPAPSDPMQVTIMSFSALALRRIRQWAPGLPTVYLMEILPPPGATRGRLPFGVRIAGPSVGLVRMRPGLLPALQAGGLQSYVWTVNTERQLHRAVAKRADGIITDRPRFVLDHLC